ncbi:N-acetylglucosamine kinase [Colwellia ponticola]|uniref:ATPase n=1 Tax=Colwellia ponticola TaxID=2304625 RepID=A0A8H2JMH1_9GAMM|nr:BadF/BadG/BcrA/BcrD ATPase family protein [Colwellia ponticola]TMM46061.1 ATPase [Colwellia ponticola]
MSTLSNTSQSLFLGIDGGGSKCKAIVMNENNEILGMGISGPGNPLHGFEQATHSITQSATLALNNAGLAHIQLHDVIAGIGLAGVNMPILFDKVSAWRHPFKTMHLTTDLLIACLGAHHGSDGAVIISGTGSCGFCCVNQQYTVVGGHGFPQGDKGSGAWFGLQAVEQVLLSLDGLLPTTLMTDALLKKLNCHSDIDLVEAVANQKATFYAQQASVVFAAAELGDKAALAIINDGAQYINMMAETLFQKKPPRLSMIGGLTSRLIPWLANTLQSRLSPPLNAPEVGAVLYARQQQARQ